MTIERLRGRAGVEDRARIHHRDGYLCQVCLDKGVHTIATQIDHIVPLEAGGSDEDGNKQAICDRCHDAKTDTESNGAAISGTPHYLRNDKGRELLVICGPYYSGRMALALSRASAGSTIVSADVLSMQMFNTRWPWQLDWDSRRQVMRSRNQALDAYLKGNEFDSCVLVVEAATFKERRYWGELATELVVMDYDVDDCRIMAQKDLINGQILQKIEQKITKWA